MKIRHHQLHGSQALSLPSGPSDSVHVVASSGRGTRLQVPAGWVSVTAILHGELELSSNDTPWLLPSRHVQVWLEGGLRHHSRSHARWMCITAPLQTWRQAHPGPLPGSALIPRQEPCPHALARPIVHLTRTRWFPTDADTPEVADAFMQLHDALIEQQQALQGELERCSGRTAARRHQTLLRLLKVQHLIRCNVDDRLDLSRLAAIANYSPTHLIRVYREVFGETPSEYAIRLRQQRAWELVQGTGLSVCEIAESLGFESESAFCRAFKHAFGCTTSEARRRQGAGPLQAARPPSCADAASVDQRVPALAP